MTKNLYIVNKNIVTSLQYRIANIKDAQYKYEYNLNYSEQDIETVSCDFLNFFGLTKTIIYLGQYISSAFECSLFLMILKDNRDNVYDYIYIYTIDDFYNYVSHENNLPIQYKDKPDTVIKGFVELCDLFWNEYKYYEKNNKLHEFMFLAPPIKKEKGEEMEICDTGVILYDGDFNISKEEADRIDAAANFAKEKRMIKESTNKLIGYVKSKTKENTKYAILIRVDENGEHHMKNLECQCPAFFFRKNPDENCKHIECVLQLTDEVPYGEMVPEEVELTAEGKDSLVRYRIDNEYQIFCSKK